MSDWILRGKHLNDIVQESLREQVGMASAGHMCDILIRVNGEWKRFEADWIKYLKPIETQPAAPQVSDAMVQKALSAYEKASEAPCMIDCTRCEGLGYHHGFGEDGVSPDWCDECGGTGRYEAPGEFERCIRIALEAALRGEGG